jgi:cytochrome b subunit of formate dehydrogenase
VRAVVSQRATLILALIATTVTLGLSWAIVYFFAYIPLVTIDIPNIDKILDVNLGSTLWWRAFLHAAYDVFIILVIAYTSIQTIGKFIYCANKAGLWRQQRKSKGVLVRKFTTWQIVQHHLFIIGFLIAALSGILLYQNNNPYWKLIAPSRETLIILHLIGAALFGGIALLHAAYYGVQAVMAKASGIPLRQAFPITRFFSFKEWKKAAIDNVLWQIGLRKEKPLFYKYNGEQMLEYWLTAAGVVIIGGTGIIMALYGPAVLDGVLWVIHVKEAVLAISSIIAGHITYVHLIPSMFPLDPSIFDGKVLVERVKEENPLWYEELKKEIGVEGEGGESRG